MKKGLVLKKLHSILIAVLFVSTIFTGIDVQASTKDSEENIDLVVLFNEDKIDNHVKDFISKSGGEVVNTLPEVGGLEVQCKAELIPELQTYNTVSSLAPNHNIKAPEEKIVKFKDNKNLKKNQNKSISKAADDNSDNNASGDLYDLYQWDIKRVTSDGKSYDLNTGNHDVVVAIVDSGVKADHPDLEGNFMGGENLIPKGFNNDETETGDSEDIEDRLGHGTYVAGIIAANGRTKGVAPNIGFKSYRIFDSEGNTNATIASSAIIKATDDGAKVINLSMSGYDLKGKCYWTDPKTGTKYKLGDDMAEYELYKRAIKYAIKHNVTVVTAAGNDGIDCGNTKKLTKYLNDQNGSKGFKYEGLTYEVPGSIDGVINVSATGKTDKIAKYSNYGKNFIDMTAPGGDSSETGSILDMCLSTSVGDYWFVEGTSIAAPKVSAVAGLILCKDSRLKPKEVAKLMYKTSEKLDGSKSKEYYGSGLVNAYNALKGKK